MSTIASFEPLEADTTVFHVVGRPTRTGPTWVWINHDLDLASLPAARAELDALLLAPEPPRFMLVYLGAERFVDVRGMRLLVDDTAGAQTWRRPRRGRRAALPALDGGPARRRRRAGAGPGRPRGGALGARAAAGVIGVDDALVRSLRELSDRLDSGAPVDPLGARLAAVVSAATELLHVDSVVLLLLDDVDRVRNVASTGRAAEAFEQAQQRIGRRSGWARRSWATSAPSSGSRTSGRRRNGGRRRRSSVSSGSCSGWPPARRTR